MNFKAIDEKLKFERELLTDLWVFFFKNYSSYDQNCLVGINFYNATGVLASVDVRVLQKVLSSFSFELCCNRTAEVMSFIGR